MFKKIFWIPLALISLISPTVLFAQFGDWGDFMRRQQEQFQDQLNNFQRIPQILQILEEGNPRLMACSDYYAAAQEAFNDGSGQKTTFDGIQHFECRYVQSGVWIMKEKLRECVVDPNCGAGTVKGSTGTCYFQDNFNECKNPMNTSTSGGGWYVRWFTGSQRSLVSQDFPDETRDVLCIAAGDAGQLKRDCWNAALSPQ